MKDGHSTYGLNEMEENHILPRNMPR